MILRFLIWLIKKHPDVVGVQVITTLDLENMIEADRRYGAGESEISELH